MFFVMVKNVELLLPEYKRSGTLGGEAMSEFVGIKWLLMCV